MPTSSVIERASYRDGDLTIKIRRGGEYRYHNVPRDTAHGLATAESAGRFYNQRIRDNFRFTRN